MTNDTESARAFWLATIMYSLAHLAIMRPPRMGQIGEERRILDVPAPIDAPVQVPDKEPEREPERVPA